MDKMKFRTDIHTAINRQNLNKIIFWEITMWIHFLKLRNFYRCEKELTFFRPGDLDIQSTSLSLFSSIIWQWNNQLWPEFLTMRQNDNYSLQSPLTWAHDSTCIIGFHYFVGQGINGTTDFGLGLVFLFIHYTKPWKLEKIIRLENVESRGSNKSSLIMEYLYIWFVIVQSNHHLLMF